MILFAKRVLALFALALSIAATAQNTHYWQQKANYTMDVTMDVNTFQYQGTQQISYTNNSPDALNQVFYHLYFNAFQPGSEMDARLSSIASHSCKTYSTRRNGGFKLRI